MAKKTTKDKTQEVVANCDRFEKAVTKCDNLENTESVITQTEIEKLIITIRGEQVLIDQDVAKLYCVTTKRLNQQANRNSDRSGKL